MERNLTDEQEKIVYCKSKLILGISTPGSGKTHTLIARAKHLCETTNENVLICTFGKKAVEEIKDRLRGYHGKIEVLTFHALCFGLIKKYWRILEGIYGAEEWVSEPRVVNRQEQLNLISELFPNNNAEELIVIFDQMRGYGLDPGTFRNLFCKKVYFFNTTSNQIDMWKQYERIRISKGLILFEDMINLACSLVTITEISVDICQRYQHILIDEAQDTSSKDWTILRPMVVSSQSTLVLGDFNQSLYGFREADGSVLSGLEGLRDAVVFRLSKSFRTGSAIASFANRIVFNKKSKINTNEKECIVDIAGFETIQEELVHVLKSYAKFDDNCAIISRTNSYLEPFERSLIVSGVNYQGKGFYRNAHIRNFVYYLRDRAGFNEIDIKKKFINNALYLPNQQDDIAYAVKLIKKFGKDSFIDHYEMSNSMKEEGVHLTTGHTAKGQEWDKVFVIGAHEGNIPHINSADFQEEQNIFYVMCTRAKTELHISYAGRPSRYIPKEDLK